VRTPLILINYKAYETSVGEKGLQIAKKAEKVSRETGVEIALAVPATMIHRVSHEVSIPVYAEHVDPDEGPHTGNVTVEMIREAGAKGSLLNHSERRITLDHLYRTLERLRASGLESIVCVSEIRALRAVGVLNPTAILIEPPELIGTGRAVSKERPELILEAVREVRTLGEASLIVGAGVTSGEDVLKALQLGANGVGLSSALMLSKDPEAKFRELAWGVLRFLGESRL
jgi:triosephosphate isomerase